MMFAGVHDGSWSGFVIFVPAMTLVAVTWWLASPFTLRHARVVQKVGEFMMWPFNALTE
jgi:methionine sulfoxide reductase catalytic subunit